MRPAIRIKLTIHGLVQGVGFRPFVYRLANELGLAGWVMNSSCGVVIEAEGPPDILDVLLERLSREAPPNSSIQSVESAYLDPVGYRDFTVQSSQTEGEKTALVMPDVRTCERCLAEVFDPADRRHRYPFTNCVDCGPRYSIIESLPYDRPGTTMRDFRMCPDCLAEYDNPQNRRFHAQPNACPACGPRLELLDCRGHTLARGDDALRRAAAEILEGRTIALKGLGGFQLLVDAGNEVAVQRLRAAKHREEKPFALMFPGMAMAREHCEVSVAEERLLLSPAAPITLLRRRESPIAPGVAPGNPHLGIMLPYTPLHCLLMRELKRPIVATSGNLRDEPICTDNDQALRRLSGVADLFLAHDRRIARPVDDSVARIIMDRPMLLRRARGYAPLPLPVRRSLPPLLAVGAHLKNTVAVADGRRVIISQHVGDLETVQAVDSLRETAQGLLDLFELKPKRVMCDLNPDLASTNYARTLGLPLETVQHHYAHVLACMADNEMEPPVLGVAWDGTGDGGDGTVWGGEFIRIAGDGWRRTAHLRSFMLPGGEAAVREPRRTALGALWEVLGEELPEHKELAPVRACSRRELKAFCRMMERGLNSPRTSSAGRLFDAVASLVGIRQFMAFEGQAAMELEWAAFGERSEECYECAFERGDPARLDWKPMLSAIIHDVARGEKVGLISRKFHNSLAGMILQSARAAGEERVVLSGGCFQNRLLAERSIDRLSEEGFRPYWHQRIPPNDGGIAAGQALAAGT